jgi:hypothetical protein
MLKCLYCVKVAAGLDGRIIIAMDGNGFDHIFLAEVKRCLSDSWCLDVWPMLGAFRWEVLLVTCFVTFVFELAPFVGFKGGGPRI